MWDELGIAPTENATAIRSAYAARLKLTRPDRDPAGFARLRAAYEQAMVLARHDTPAQPDALEAAPDFALPRDNEVPAAAGMDAAPDYPRPPVAEEEGGGDTLAAIAARLVAAFRGGDAAAALEIYEAAWRGGTLPIRAEMVLTDIVLDYLVGSRDVAPAFLSAAAARFGWDGLTVAAEANPRLRALQARLRAETWYATMQKRARSPLRFLGAHRSGAAALLFGKGGVFFSRYYPPLPELLSALSELRAQAHWVGHRFDPRRIDALDRVIADIRHRAQGRASDRPRWRHAFDRTNLPITLIAAPGAFVVYALTWTPIAASVFFLFSRAVLAYRLRLRRPYALAAVLFLAAGVALSVSHDDKPRLVIPFATLVPSVNMNSPQLPVDFAFPRAAPRIVISAANMNAARQGDLDAMRGIGRTIIGSARDEASLQRGAAWLTAAANRGSPEAMLDLANLYGDLNRDYILYDSDLAYFWSGVAVAWGGRLARMASETHARLRAAVVHADIADLDQRIRTWKPTQAALPK